MIKNLEIGHVRTIPLSVVNWTNHNGVSNAPSLAFLYGINRKDSKLEYLKDAGGLFLRQYFRPADSEQIDGWFDFNYNGKMTIIPLKPKTTDKRRGRKLKPKAKDKHKQPITNNPRRIAIEFNDGSNLEKVVACLDKFAGYQFGIMICSHFRGRIGGHPEFVSKCRSDKINPFDLEPCLDEGGGYEIVPFGKTAHTTQPALMFLAIDISKLHRFDVNISR